MSPRRPRVAHVLNTMGHGGVPRVAYQLLERLPDDYELFLYGLSSRARDAVARDRQVDRLRGRGVTVRLADAAGASAAGEQVGRWLDVDGIDVVHTHSTKPNRHARAAALRRGGVRTVAHYHNQYDDKWAVADALQAERSMARTTDRLVACSEAVRAHVADRLQVGPEHVTVVPNAVDVDDYRSGDGARVRAELGIAPGVPVVGTVGRISRQKAPADVVAAARVICDRHPHAVVLLVGETDTPELEREVRSLVRDLGLDGRVLLLGYRDDLADVYAALDVFVLASHWEGFGLVLVEAMAAGVPVVATRVGAVPEVVAADEPSRAAALLVAPAVPGELAAAACRLLEDPSAAAELVDRGRDRALDFSWDESARRLDRLYRQLTDRTTGDGT